MDPPGVHFDVRISEVRRKQFIFNIVTCYVYKKKLVSIVKLWLKKRGGSLTACQINNYLIEKDNTFLNSSCNNAKLIKIDIFIFRFWLDTKNLISASVKFFLF